MEIKNIWKRVEFVIKGWESKRQKFLNLVFILIINQEWVEALGLNKSWRKLRRWKRYYQEVKETFVASKNLMEILVIYDNAHLNLCFFTMLNGQTKKAKNSQKM